MISYATQRQLMAYALLNRAVFPYTITATITAIRPV